MIVLPVQCALHFLTPPTATLSMFMLCNPFNFTATALGYNKKLWDKDVTPDDCDEDWEDLTPEQQKAAAVLGYDQKSWDSSK